MIKRLLLLSSLAFTGCMQFPETQNQSPSPDHLLWYEQPARNWMEALPIGNGHLGAMVFGDTLNERIQLNEDSLWPGGPDENNSKGTQEDLELIRRLIEEGRIEEADKEIVARFSYKGIVKSHQTMGDLYLSFEDRGPIKNYRRSLDLNTAVTEVNYTAGEGRFTQRVFASAPDDAIVIELTSTESQGMNLTLKLDRPLDQGKPTVEITNPSNAEISMKGEVTQNGGRLHSEPAPLDYGVKFETLLKAETDGSGHIEAKEGNLVVKGARKVLIKLVASTSFYEQDFQAHNRRTMAALEAMEFQDLVDRHVRDYQNFFNRVTLKLGQENLDSLPTDQRLRRLQEQELEDQDLVADLFQFGRYLLISSSRPQTNPANLQGLWNEHIAAPWNADYHLNVNLQMNYWPAGVTNLSELQLPLFDFSDRLIERGRITARKQYGINRGAVAHQASDLWADTFMRAEQPYWGSWIHGGGWLAQHYWEHYRFTQDSEFLRERAYPALKAFSEFYLDWLVWDDQTGKWVSTPETSPENSYINHNRQRGAVSFGSAMGHQIIGEVFDNTLSAAQILGIEDDFVGEVREKRADLFPGVVIGEHGRILEWNEAYEEPEKGHRHLSHLYALHPGDEITVSSPELFEAARNSIEYRLEHGGAGTGWSRAWMINFYGRLLDGEAAHDHLNKFMQISVADNMFDLHPPFQIDGNFGFTAGIAEMLLQSHEDFIRILPALPTTWENGKITGLKARGGITVDIEWNDSELHRLRLHCEQAKTLNIQYQEKDISLEVPEGQTISLNVDLEKIE